MKLHKPAWFHTHPLVFKIRIDLYPLEHKYYCPSVWPILLGCPPQPRLDGEAHESFWLNLILVVGSVRIQRLGLKLLGLSGLSWIWKTSSWTMDNRSRNNLPPLLHASMVIYAGLVVDEQIVWVFLSIEWTYYGPGYIVWGFPIWTTFVIGIATLWSIVGLPK